MFFFCLFWTRILCIFMSESIRFKTMPLKFIKLTYIHMFKCVLLTLFKICSIFRHGNKQKHPNSWHTLNSGLSPMTGIKKKCTPGYVVFQCLNGTNKSQMDFWTRVYRGVEQDCCIQISLIMCIGGFPQIYDNSVHTLEKLLFCYHD